jgi:hypothetical protein
MNTRYLASQFRQSTLAAMIVDLLDMPVANAELIEVFLKQLEHSVGDEMAIDFLIDAGATPEALEMARA